MKIVISLDEYQLEHCKRHVEERYSNLIEEAVVKGDLLDDVLDEIRAEIEKEIIPRNSDQYDHEAKWQNSGLRMALKAIEKYKAESEEQK